MGFRLPERRRRPGPPLRKKIRRRAALVAKKRSRTASRFFQKRSSVRSPELPPPSIDHHASPNRNRNAKPLHQISKLHWPLPNPPHRPAYHLDRMLPFYTTCFPPPRHTRLLHAFVNREPRNLNRTPQSPLIGYLFGQIHQDGEIPAAYHGAGYHCASCALQGVGQGEWGNAVFVRGKCAQGSCGKVEWGLSWASRCGDLFDEWYASGGFLVFLWGVMVVLIESVINRGLESQRGRLLRLGGWILRGLQHLGKLILVNILGR